MIRRRVTRERKLCVDKKCVVFVNPKFCALIPCQVTTTSNDDELPRFDGSWDDGVSGSDDGEHGGSGDNSVDDGTQLESMN